MRPREQRIPVSVPARLRHPSGWSDATVLNMSSNGLMFSSPVPVQRGEYIELRRGPYVIVARVAWSNGMKCGARSQNPLPVDDIVKLRPPPKRISADIERRANPRRTSDRHGQSRLFSRYMEKTAIGLVGLVAAVSIAHSVYTVLSKPFDSVVASLAVK